jgi:hypothetical protein
MCFILGFYPSRVIAAEDPHSRMCILELNGAGQSKLEWTRGQRFDPQATTSDAILKRKLANHSPEFCDPAHEVHLGIKQPDFQGGVLETG